MHPLEIYRFIETNPHISHVFPYGSRVYGTFEATSDHDYIGIVQSDVDATEEPLKVSDGVEISLYSVSQFNEMIRDHHITALECIWLDSLIPSGMIHFALNPVVLRESISEKISHSWVKGKKKLTVGSVPPREDDRRSGLKSIFHSFRICDYGIQIMEHGKIIDYGSMNHYWDRLKKFSGTWDELNREFKPEFNSLKTKFKLICPKDRV